MQLGKAIITDAKSCTNMGSNITKKNVWSTSIYELG